MNISGLDLNTVKDFCGIYDTVNDRDIEQVYMPAAKAFIMGYTGLTAKQLDEHCDLAIAYMVLINEMYTQRDYTVDKDKLNPCVETILHMYAVNYI